MNPRRALLLALSLSLLLAPFPRPAAAQQGGGPIYLVQPGDTLSEIARSFGTTVEAIVTANGLATTAPLQVGQELRIPGFEGLEGVLTSHRVELGEDFESLAWAYGAEAASLARLNRGVRPNRLFVGQSVIVPGGADGELAPRTGRGYWVTGNQPLAYRAALRGANPWDLALQAQGWPRRWLVPGELVPQPASDGAARPWPAAVRELTVTPTPAAQGNTLSLTVRAEPGWQAAGQLAGEPLNFMDAGGGEWVALQGIHAMAEPGLYELELVLSTREGDSYGVEQPFPIREGGYGLDPVLIVPDETVGPGNTEPEDRRIAELVAPATPEKRWEGAFSFPYEYFTESFPSVFGTRRNYNNTGYNSYHTGLDFYGGVGVEILAPAPGQVVFADELTVRGNSTVIDHGWGVYSLYLHQSEILVSEGDQVEAGDVIGLVGATGRVTGAHLHWEIQVGGVPVNPLDWVRTSYPPGPSASGP